MSLTPFSSLTVLRFKQLQRKVTCSYLAPAPETRRTGTDRTLLQGGTSFQKI